MVNAFNKLQILHTNMAMMLSNFLTNDKQVIMQYKVAHLSHQNEL